MLNVIEASGVRFRYPTSEFELAVAEWVVPEGAQVAVTGPSGCGKSTLLNLIAGVDVPYAGRLTVAGHDRIGASDAARRRHRIQNIGFVFQDFPLLDYLTVLDNVLLPYRLNPVFSLDNGVRERAHELLGSLDLDGLMTRYPDQLSQGERQRVAVARALVTEPRLLLADEPTTGLDERRADQLLTLIRRLSDERGLTMVMVTHDRRICTSLDAVLELGGTL